MLINRYLKVATTWGAGLITLFFCSQAWHAYVLAPWTRDGRVSAQVVRVVPEVSGRIEQMPIQDNQPVHQGDVLYRIDQSAYLLVKRQRQAELAEARVSFEQRSEQLRRRLYLKEAIAREEIDNAARAQAIAKARLGAVQSQLAQAELDLARTIVRAPVDGYVTQLRLQPGDYAVAGAVNVALVARHSFWITAYFEETKLPSIRQGAPATIKLMGFTSLLHGHVASMGRGIADGNELQNDTGLPQVSPTFSWIRLAQRVPVRIELDQVPADVELAAGMTASVDVASSEHEKHWRLTNWLQGVHVMSGYLWRLTGTLPRPWSKSTRSYVLRSIVAASLALFVAFHLQLDSPFSAASTVLLLINPIQGAVIGKGMNRLAGTLIGMLAAFVLIGLFAQKMLLFIVATGAWLGICVATMTLLRHYPATAAVVAGYTVCLALGPAIGEPQQSFEHIMSRTSSVVVGVVSLSLVAALFSKKTIEQTLRQNLRRVSARTLRILASRLARTPTDIPVGECTQLCGEIGKVDDLLGIGRGESVRVKARLGEVRTGMVHLQSALFDVPLSDDKTLGWPDLSRRLMQVGQALDSANGDFANAAQAVGEVSKELGTHRVQSVTGSLTAQRARLRLERLGEQLAEIGSALRHFASLEGAKPEAHQGASFHRDYPDAVRSGLRALLASLMAGALWYFSGWNQGPSLLAVVGPYCTLLAASALAAQGTLNCLKGTLYAIPLAALCKFLLMPQLHDLPPLIFVLSIFWSFGIHATTQPHRALHGLAYLITFNTLVGTGGTAQYDFLAFANESLAWLAALFIGLLSYQLIPKHNTDSVRTLRKALHRQTQLMLRQTWRADQHRWRSRQQHRVILLEGIAPVDGRAGSQRLGYLSLQLARELARLQRRLDSEPDATVLSCAVRGKRRLSKPGTGLKINVVQSRRTANSLERLGAFHLAAIYHDLAWLLAEYDQALHGPDTPTTG